MTVLNIIEQVEQLFPELGRTQILLDIDSSQKEFADNTKILTKQGQLSGISTNISWALPSDCVEVYDIELYGSDDMELYLDEEDLTYHIDRDVITFLDEDDDSLTRLPSAISYAYLDYVYRPASITLETDSLSIPEDFHEGILAKVLSKYYARFPQQIITSGGVIKAVDLKMVSYWESVYDKQRIEAKRWVNVNKNNIGSEAKKDILGYPISVRRKRNLTSGAIPVNAYNLFYSKYYRFTATSPSTLTENEISGFSGAITLSIVGGTITVSSSAEFTSSMFIVPNQSVNYSYISASAIEIYPPSGWGTLVVEIYKR